MTEKEKKGKIGEDIVHHVIEDALRIAGVEGTIFDNVIVEYSSIFGYYGVMTAEIDHIVVTKEFVFIIETKNQELSQWNMKSSEWILKNGDTVSNPVIQNQNHKKIFCSLMGIPREAVITIECLLNQSLNCNYICNTNDYIFGGSNITDYLVLLFSSKGNFVIDNEKVKAKINEYVKVSASKKQIHNQNVKKAKSIQNWLETHKVYHKFKLTDIAYCPECNALLNFVAGSWRDIERNNVRKSPQYKISCSSYRESGCEFTRFYSKFKEIMVTNIEERNGWIELEKCNITILDEYAELKKNQSDYIRQIDMLNMQLESTEKDNTNLREELRQLDAENDELQRKYKHLFGPFFIRR